MKKRRVRRHSVVQPLDQSIRLIPLTQGQNAVVDAEDFDWLNQWNWCARFDIPSGNFYAERRIAKPGGTVPVSMARLILGLSGNVQADHRDLDTLNNRRGNLRPATDSQNRSNVEKRKNNTSGFKGVGWNKRLGKWVAAARYNGKSFHLGCFTAKEDAAKSYDAFAREKHGEFARTNF